MSETDRNRLVTLLKGVGGETGPKLMLIVDAREVLDATDWLPEMVEAWFTDDDLLEDDVMLDEIADLEEEVRELKAEIDAGTIEREKLNMQLEEFAE